MPFDSILYSSHEATDEPASFRDLNLDQVVEAITQGKEEYNLKPFFRAPLRNVGAVRYRQDVFRDLERPEILDGIRAFADAMRRVRSNLELVEKLSNQHQAGLWFLQSVRTYGEAALALSDDLKTAASAGLQTFREWLKLHVESAGFRGLVEPARTLLAEVAEIRYVVVIIGLRVEVRPYQGEADYSEEISRNFARFQQDEGLKFPFDSQDSLDMNHVELNILNGVAQLNGDLFARVATHVAAHRGFLEPTLTRFDREVQFYVAFVEHIQRLNLSFCYPSVSASDKHVAARGAFDIALAFKLAAAESRPVTNDFELVGEDRMIVVSGPNQGGKTTFGRMFGQLHYLGSLGCPVPGIEAKLLLADQLLTHFERQEDAANLRGKLEDDIVRIHAILDVSTPSSLIIVNEIFASTSLQDAIFLSEQVAEAVRTLDALCVWVTFIEELSRMPKAVSYVSSVQPDNPAVRTFKVVKRPADGLAYAMSIAERHRLTYEAVRRRIDP